MLFPAGAVYSILGCSLCTHSIRSEGSTLGLPSLEDYQSCDDHQTKYSESEHSLLGAQMASRINLPPRELLFEVKGYKSPHLNT